MKPCLVDVNIVLALLVRQHTHHAVVRSWFETLPPAHMAVCRTVHLAVIRLLCNRTVMNEHALTAAGAWRVLAELFEDERLIFVPEPAGVDSLLPSLLTYPVPTGKLVSDAYLAACAIASSRQLATLDNGFRQFQELDVFLLASH